MTSDECPPAEFESHGDAAWFRNKAQECRRFAGISLDPNVHVALMDLSDDFQRQSEHAMPLAAIAFGRPGPGG